MPFFGSRKEHIEVFNVCVPSPLFELGEHPFGILSVVGRADMMRTRAHQPHVLAQVFGAGDSAKLCLPITLHLRRISQEALQSWRRSFFSNLLLLWRRRS